MPRRGASWGLFLWLSLLAALPLAALAFVQVSSDSCAVALGPQALALPRCPPTAKTLAQAKEVAWRFAPIVYMHPLELFHLQSPPAYFAAAEIYYPDFKNSSDTIYPWMTQNDVDELMFMPRSFATLLNNTNISEERRDEVLAGAPVDERNRSTADVYFTVAEVPDSPGTWMYTYNLYYSWNGCSNQDIALSLNGQPEVLQYVMCPTGVHEGDWEHISVLVCAETLEIQQTAYSQHGWWETRDCTQGQCVFEAGDDPAVLHPVSHAGFESHANYYVESPLAFYAWKNASIKGVELNNLGGVWVGDRTLKDPDYSFVPTPENIKFLPNMTELDALPPAAQAEWSWARYPGNWGAPLQDQAIRFYCLNNEQTEVNECPPDLVATKALKTSFALLDTVSMVTGGGGVKQSFNEYEFEYFSYNAAGGSNYSSVGAATITGPLFRTYSYQWLPMRQAPIFKDFPSNATLTCPRDAPITAAYPDPAAFDAATTLDTIVNYLVGISVGALVLSVLLVVIMAAPGLVSKSIETPTLLYSYGKQAGSAFYQSAAAALASTSKVQQDGVAAAADPALAAGAAAGAGADALHGKAAAAGAAAEAAGGHLEVVPGRHDSATPFTLYALAAFALYVAAVVLLALGIEVFVENSVAAVAQRLANGTQVVEAIKWLCIGGLILVGVCDLNALFVVMIAHRPTFKIWKWSFRNRLYSAWVNRHAYRWHIVTSGLIILVISIAAILFGLGLVIVVIQLAVRLICSNIADVDLDGITTADVCVTIPSLSGEPICGWQVMEVCYTVTDMGVVKMLLGAMLLLWAHIIWLVVLLLSMWRFQHWRVTTVEPDEASPAPSAEVPSGVGGGDAEKAPLASEV